MDLVSISRTLGRRTNELTFSAPVTHVYNPLVYARAPHEEYLRRYGEGRKQVILLGMNPGPFGMAQTGVPFGDVTMVREFLGINGTVKRPPREHPKRPVEGFACSRNEVSGTRLWGWARERFKTSAAFFRRFFVVNYCPLAFMEESGRNLTPDRLPAKERDPLLAICDDALQAIVLTLQPEFVVGVGGFAEKRARAALPTFKGSISCILHPSPASPAANRGWAQVIEGQLESVGIRLDP